MKNLPSPDDLGAERDAIIAEIYAAWKGVTREGGVSWNETWCIGDPLEDTPQDRAAAREKDDEFNWEEFADNPPWSKHGHPTLFLDPIASRYYIAPMLLCTLRGKSIHHVQELLLLTAEGFLYRHDRWSLLDGRQQVCIARFLNFMHHSHCFEHSVYFQFNEWHKILESHWNQFDQPH